MVSKDKELMKRFEAETGKNAIWRGKITKGFLDWKKKQERKSKAVSIPQSISKSPVMSEIQLNIRKIFSILSDYDLRLKILESKALISKGKEISEEISEKHFLRILKTVYNSSEKKFGDFVPISRITEKIKEYIPWSTVKIHSELYKLFIDYEIDLQPGKNVEGVPLIQDGKKFVWFKFK